MEIDQSDVKALISILQKLVANSGTSISKEDELLEEPRSKTIHSKSKNIKKPRAKKNKTEHINLFEDMPEKNMHKEDIAIDKKLKKFAPTPRRRPSLLLDVKCRVCGKEESVSAKMLPETSSRYKCNDCSQSGG